MKPPNFAPIYVGCYPALAELCREHGYALAVHGSAGRDFDLVAVPWAEEPSEPGALVASITSKFAFLPTAGGNPKEMAHGRLCWTLAFSFDTCFLDFSVMRPSKKVEGRKDDEPRSTGGSI